MYPLYLADVDGISHTTIAIACLRKLQGWHIDSILDEISRFEPDHEELPILPFINSYHASTESIFQLPSPPYPAWLWPISSSPAISPSLPKPGSRERTASHLPDSRALAQSSLPFIHPMTSGKHPTMRLGFPPMLMAVQSPPLTRATKVKSTAQISSREDQAAGEDNQPVAGPSKVANIVNSDRVESLSPSATSDATPQNMLTNTGGGGSEELTSEEPYTETPGDAEYEDEEDEDEDDESGEGSHPTSQYISALDLAGFG